jgi:hypothetical protein
MMLQALISSSSTHHHHQHPAPETQQLFFATKQENSKAVFSQYVPDEKQLRRRNSKINSVG